MPHPPPPILRITDLNVIRDGHSILTQLSWTVQPGENWVLLGPNGSGKSSLLSVLSGYFFPTKGSFEVLGNQFGHSDWRALRSHLGIVSATLAAMVPQDEPAAFSVLTGRDGGIGLWADVGEAEVEEARRSLAQVEAESLLWREWRHLSQGERQRVLIARALIREPDLLILDEPCAGLDPAARERFLQFLERLLKRKDGPAVVLVTHHVEEIVTGFTHLLALRGGCVAASGPVETTLDSVTLTNVFQTPLKLLRQNQRYHLEFRHQDTDTEPLSDL
jgi:iron complex transport system ATP-binding protein